MDPIIKGELVTLRPATITDRRSIYEWLTNSDLTALMLGSPSFPENPVPTWDEFMNDYTHHFFDGSQPTLGRCFVIEVNNEPVGQVNYNDIWNDNSTELDIWLAGSHYTKKGYGPDALITLCTFLNKEFDCNKFIIAPSRRNGWAIKAYQKAGFVETTEIPVGLIPDYDDTVVMIKYPDR